MAQDNRRRLVLHFDCNNTILMNDHAKGLDTIMNVQRIVCKSAWGAMFGSGETATWQLAHDQLNFCKPAQVNSLPALPEGTQPSDYTISTYYDFIQQKIPKDAADRADTLKGLVAKFAAQGGPGAKFRVPQDKLFKQLLLPKGAREELGIVGDAMDAPGDEPEAADSDDDEDKKEARARAHFDKQMTYKLFGDGRYNIIPSFFRMLIFLRKQKKEFAIAFRTYGVDLDNVIFEFNKFCNGDHPCFNGRNGTPLVKMDGSKNSKDFRFKANEQHCKFYRDGFYKSETSQATGKVTMVQGEHERAADFQELMQIGAGDETTDLEVCSDALEIHQNILETLKRHASIGIQDDYKSWKAMGYDCSAGKILHLDQSDYNTQHIFFDDNADEGRECIIDCRDVITGAEIPQDKYMNMYVVKVQPHRAILEGDYFIKQIEMCEAARDEEIKQIESGEVGFVSSAPAKASNEEEWAKLQALGDQEYLMRTVLPVLYQGMRVVDLERPEAPLESLALYLLKHQDMIPPLPTAPKMKKVDDEDDQA